MSEKVPQTYANHGKFVPLYHYLLSLLIVVNLGWSAWRLFRSPSAESGVFLILAIAMVLLFLFARVFPLKVQDRLIRLEERLRIGALAPDDLKGRIDELTPSQMVALRFAGDDEVVDLARQVLDESLTDQREIKKRIKNWRPDLHRV